MDYYLPFGKKVIPNDEKYQQTERLFALYDYYGIPYGIFDGSDEGSVSRKEKVRNIARQLLQKGEKISPELETELLKYKEQDKKKIVKQ